MIDKLLHLFTLSTLESMEDDLERAYVEPDTITIPDEDEFTKALEAIRTAIMKRITS